MISINQKNPDSKSVNADFTEGVLSNVFTDLNKRKEDNLDKLDNIAEPIKDELTSAKTFTDDLAKATGRVNGALSSLATDRRSIVARAKNSILQFPIYIANTVPIAPAHAVSKTVERVMATFVQTALAQYPLIDEDSINNLAFLKKFHTNLKESANSLYNEYYQPIDDFDMIMQESISNTLLCENGVIARFNVVPTDNAQLIAENARLINDPLSGFENFFAEAAVANVDQKESKTRTECQPITDEDFATIIGKEKPIEPKEPPKELTDVLETKPPQGSHESDDDYQLREKEWQKNQDRIEIQYQKDVANYPKAKAKYDADIKAYNDELARVKKAIEDGSNDYDYKGKRVTYDPVIKRFTTIDKSTDIQKKSIEFKAPVMLKDTDIKKINGMLPYTFDASFTIKGDNGIAGNIVHYIIGVKSVLHLIQPKDLSAELQDLITGDVKNLQKVRYKTGEISFWKDYMFRKDSLKADASKHLDGSKRWINTLKHLADWNKEHGSMLDKPAAQLAGGDIPIPNGTLVLTQPDVLRMKSETGIDLEDVSMAKKLAKNLFLITVIILDISAGTMKVLFTDSDTSWDVQSIASIDAEVAKTDNSNLLKELNRVINK